MKVIFVATFLLIISGAQAISNEDEDFNMNFTSKDSSSINHSNEQAYELLGTISLTFQTSTNLIFRIFYKWFESWFVR
jgi:hypothetical protein